MLRNNSISFRYTMSDLRNNQPILSNACFAADGEVVRGFDAFDGIFFGFYFSYFSGFGRSLPSGQDIV